MPTYLITDHANHKRVVEARTPAGARQHVARDLEVHKISAREAFTLSAAGLELETAGEEAANDTAADEAADGS